jgi:hypothetical protein
MIDARNSYEKKIRYSSARKGYQADKTGQKRYITWHLWGHLNRSLNLDQFIDSFHSEWDKVLKHNIDNYDRLDPWIKSGSSYKLNKNPTIAGGEYDLF